MEIGEGDVQVQNEVVINAEDETRRERRSEEKKS